MHFKLLYLLDIFNLLVVDALHLLRLDQENFTDFFVVREDVFKLAEIAVKCFMQSLPEFIPETKSWYGNSLILAPREGLQHVEELLSLRNVVEKEDFIVWAESDEQLGKFACAFAFDVSVVFKLVKLFVCLS